MRGDYLHTSEGRVECDGGGGGDRGEGRLYTGEGSVECDVGGGEI